MGNDKEKLKALALRMHAEDQEDQTALLTRGEIQAFNALLEEWEDATRAVTILALLAEIEELQKAVELHAGNHVKADMFDQVVADRDHYKRLYEEAARDAGRYRHISDRKLSSKQLDDMFDLYGHPIDSSIDSAIAARLKP